MQYNEGQEFLPTTFCFIRIFRTVPEWHNIILKINEKFFFLVLFCLFVLFLFFVCLFFFLFSLLAKMTNSLITLHNMLGQCINIVKDRAGN